MATSEYNKKYRLEHRESRLAYGKEWRKTHREYMREVSRRRQSQTIVFLGKDVYLGWNPRLGICQRCEERGITDMHHKKYIPIMPWAATTELCKRCHTEIRGHNLPERYCYECGSNTTIIEKGNQHWYRFGSDSFLCNKCYCYMSNWSRMV